MADLALFAATAKTFAGADLAWGPCHSILRLTSPERMG